MKTTAILAAALILAACSVATQALDENTGTTKAQRCVDYRGLYAAAVVLQANAPTDARAARIGYYRAFLDANCGG